MICLKDVSKIYNQGKANETQALQHVTLTIKREIWLPLPDRLALEIHIAAHYSGH